MIDRRSLVVASLCFAAQSIAYRSEAANSSLRAQSDTGDCREVADEIEAEMNGRMFDPSLEELSWAPRLSDN